MAKRLPEKTYAPQAGRAGASHISERLKLRRRAGRHWAAVSYRYPGCIQSLAITSHSYPACWPVTLLAAPPPPPPPSFLRTARHCNLPASYLSTPLSSPLQLSPGPALCACAYIAKPLFGFNCYPFGIDSHLIKYPDILSFSLNFPNIYY